MRIIRLITPWALVCIFGAAGVGAVVLELQASSAIQHADVAISGKGGLLPTMTATAADAGEQGTSTIASVGARLDASLGKLDAQVATVEPAVQKLGPVLDGLKDDTAKLGSAIDAVDRPCETRDASGKDMPCGFIADADRTLAPVRGAFGSIEVAGRHWDRNLTTLDTQEATLFANFNGTAIRLNTALETLNLQMANPDLALMMHNGGEFTTTAVAVEKKLAQCTLRPTFPCVFKDAVILGAQTTGYLLH